MTFLDDPDEFDKSIIKFTPKEMVDFLMENRFIRREVMCVSCGIYMSLSKYTKSKDKYGWRCYNSKCKNHKKYFSIRINSFFNDFSIPFVDVFRIIIKYGCRVPLYCIINSIRFNRETTSKVIQHLKALIPQADFSNDKLGGPGKIIQVDETMLNYKIKSHRGRTPNNKTDALCIVETIGSITKCYAEIINDKKMSTILPIIIKHVSANSVIHTDEHGAYCKLKDYFLEHSTVCHKYEFVNSNDGTHTQSIESFHNELKLEIKRRKGVKSNERRTFLREFCFYFNNRNNFFTSIINLIKI